MTIYFTTQRMEPVHPEESENCKAPFQCNCISTRGNPDGTEDVHYFYGHDPLCSDEDGCEFSLRRSGRTVLKVWDVFHGTACVGDSCPIKEWEPFEEEKVPKRRWWRRLRSMIKTRSMPPR